MWLLCLVSVTLLLTGSLAWKDYDFRFRDPSVTKGAVEVFFKEKWHCSYSAPLFLFGRSGYARENVVCSSMGFRGGKAMMHQKGGKPCEDCIFIMAHCTGTEKHLEQCPNLQTKVSKRCIGLQVECTGELKESPGSIDCKQDKFKLSLNVGPIRQFFHEVDPDKITLSDSSCMVGDGNRPITIEAPFNRCGTTSSNNSTDRTYTNQLMYTDSSGLVTKLQTITCSFGINVRVTQKVKTIPQSVMVISGRGKVPLTMNVYRDPQLKEKFVHVLFQPSEVLYIKLSLGGTNSNLRFLPKECHSRSTQESSNSPLNLILEGCPVAGRAKLLVSPTKGVVVAVKTAMLKDVSADQINIVCTASPCQNKCTPKCPPVGSNASASKGRRKRDVELLPGVASVYEGSVLLKSRKMQ